MARPRTTSPQEQPWLHGGSSQLRLATKSSNPWSSLVGTAVAADGLGSQGPPPQEHPPESARVACAHRPLLSAEHPPPPGAAAPAHAAGSTCSLHSSLPEEGRDPECGGHWPHLGKTRVCSEQAVLSPNQTWFPAAGVHREAIMSCGRVLRRPTKAVYPSPARLPSHVTQAAHTAPPLGKTWTTRIPSQAREATRQPLNALHYPTQYPPTSCVTQASSLTLWASPSSSAKWLNNGYPHGVAEKVSPPVCTGEAPSRP